MDLYEKLISHIKKDDDQELSLTIISTFKPDARYSVSRIDPSEVTDDEWLKKYGVDDELSLEILGKIEFPENLKGVSCELFIESPNTWGEIKDKESALGWGFDDGDKRLHLNIRLNSNIQKNIIEKMFWINKLLIDPNIEKFIKQINFVSFAEKINQTLSDKDITDEERRILLDDLWGEKDEKENKENQDLDFKIVIKNLKKVDKKIGIFERKFSFTVESMHF